MAEERKDLTAMIERAIKRHLEDEACCEAAEEVQAAEPAVCETPAAPKVSVQSYSGNSGILTDSKCDLSVSAYNGNAGKLDQLSNTTISVQSYGGNASVVNPMASKGDEGYTYQRFNGKNAGEVPMGNWQKAKASGAASTPGFAGGEGIPVPQGELRPRSGQGAGIDPMVQEIIKGAAPEEKNGRPVRNVFNGKHLFIAESADVVGNVKIGEDSNVWYQAVIRGDQEPIVIGSRSNVQDGCVVHVAPGYPTVLGDDVTIGHNCTIHGCTIEDNVLIGMSSTVLNGAVIGKNSIVGAKSLVTQNKVFPEGSLIMGSPAKLIRPLTPEEIAGITENALEYVRLMDLEAGKAFVESEDGTIITKK